MKSTPKKKPLNAAGKAKRAFALGAKLAPKETSPKNIKKAISKKK